MFCGKCGTQIPDGAAFCPSCGNGAGNQTTDTQAPDNTVTTNYAAPQKKLSSNAVIGIAVGAIVVALAIILICVFAGGTSSGASGDPDGVVLSFNEAILDGDADAMISCLPDDIIDIIVEDDFEGEKSDFIDEIEAKLTGEEMAVIKEYGLDVDFEIVNVEENDDEDEINAWINEIEDDYGVKLDITGIASVDMNVTISGNVMGQDINTTDKEEYAVIEIDGKWYLHPECFDF